MWIDASIYFSIVGKGNITINFLFNQSQSLTEIGIEHQTPQIVNTTIKPIINFGLEHSQRNISVENSF